MKKAKKIKSFFASLDDRSFLLTVFFAVNFSALAVTVVFLLLDRATDGELFACSFHRVLGLYCPGCGSTRALKSLLRFDILSAVRYNFAFVFLVFTVIYYEIFLIASIIRGDRKYFVKSGTAPLLAAAILLIGNFILKNVLLIVFGIDIIGDFL